MNALFTKVLEAGFYGSIIIVLVLALRLVLKKAPRWMICLLWLLAAVRLLCPFQIESGFSLQPDLASITQVQTQLTPEDGLTMVPAVPDNVVFPEGDDFQVVIWDDAVIEEHHQIIEWGNIASFVWAAVAAAMVLYSIAAYLKLKHRVREASKLADNVYECAGLETAFVLGYLWPRIYIPMGLENPKYIVDHERAHIQRGDHWFKLLMFAALALHWFNPLVWAAYACMCRDVEMACDERVVRDFNLNQRKAYSAALLACSAGRRSFAACPVAFGEVSVKSRILGVLHYRKPRFWICLIAVVAIIIVAVCFMTNPPEAADAAPTDPTEESSPVNDSNAEEAEATDPLETVWDAAYFETLFNPQMYRGEYDWYNLALTSYYSTPEEIDLYWLFYNGFLDQDEDPTPEELVFLEAQPGFEPYYGLKRLPTAEMDAVLAKYFGTTLVACNQTGMDMLAYWDQTDCYYCWHTDSGMVENIRVTDCTEQADGTYRIAYTEGYLETPAVVVVRPVNDGWQFISNLPAA